jgi:hypothetical protein
MFSQDEEIVRVKLERGRRFSPCRADVRSGSPIANPRLNGGRMDAQQVLQGAQDAMSVRRVFGEPIQAEGMTILPVAAVGGGGGGGGRGQDGGAGYGMGVRPAGVYVIRNGRATWRPAVNVNLIVAGGQLVAIAALFALRPILVRWLQNRAGVGLQAA